MPQPDRPHDEAISRLDARMEKLQAMRQTNESGVAKAFTGEGSRFLGEVVSGVLGGAGLGWLVDNFLTHRPPFGLLIGLFAGTGLSIFFAVRQAAQRTKQAMEQAGPLPSVPDDEDED